MKVLVATGSSGGHLMPAAGFIEAFRKRYPEADVRLLAPDSTLLPQLETLDVRITRLKKIRLSRRISVMPGGICALLSACLRSFKVLVHYHPDVVIGFGTVHALPAVLLAWFFRIRTVVHEQNVVPGRANRLLAKLVDAFCVSFPETRAYLGGTLNRVIVTGSPLRGVLQDVSETDALRFFGFDRGAPVVLVMGGSQGSRALNRHFTEAVCQTAGEADFQLIHITGNEAEAARSRMSYAKKGMRARVYPFLGQIQYAYRAADLAFCRSGAMTVAELRHFRLPAVLIPYPFASKHQMANAGLLEKDGCAVIIRDEDLTPERIRGLLREMFTDSGGLCRLRSGCVRREDADAGDKLVQAAVSAE